MNWLDFFASVFASIASLAWPAAVVAAVYMFRGELRPLLPRLRLKHKETEISFRLDGAEYAAEQLPAPQSPPETPEERNRVEQLADLSPTAVVLEARRDLDAAIRFKANAVGLEAERKPIVHMIRELRMRQEIPPQISALLDDLRAVGNAAAHDRNYAVTKETALRYRELADNAIGHLYFYDGNGSINTSPSSS
jgi:hypothetical protein